MCTAGESEKLLKEPGATLLTVFGPKLAGRQRNVRYLVVLEAADITLRKDAQAWLHACEAGQTQHAHTLESNRGLAAVLAELEALREE